MRAKQKVMKLSYDGDRGSVEKLLWLSQRSRPDIAFPVSIMGSLLTKAAPRSIEIGMRLLSYLQRTVGVALELKPESGGFEAWSDCSFAPSGCRSHSGMAITWNKAVIGWRSGRQPFTCLSTAEGELVAAIETLTLAMSLKAIVDEFGELGVLYDLMHRQSSCPDFGNPRFLGELAHAPPQNPICLPT